MSLVPRTLFWRNVLVMMALIALAEAASSVIYLQYVQKPRVVQLGDSRYKRKHDSQWTHRRCAVDARALPAGAGDGGRAAAMSGG